MSVDLRARAREMRANGTSYNKIADALGVGVATAYRWLNPEFEQAQRERAERWKKANPDRVREHGREAVRRRSGACSNCGGQMANRKPTGVCMDCRMAAREARQHQIQDMWLDGATIAQIAEAVGVSQSSLGVEMHRMRSQGWDLPLRRPFGQGWTEEVAA